MPANSISQCRAGSGGPLLDGVSGPGSGADGEPQERHPRLEVGRAARFRAGRDPVRRRYEGGGPVRDRHGRPDRGRREGARRGQGCLGQDRGHARNRCQADHDQRSGRQPAVRQRLPIGLARPRPRRDSAIGSGSQPTASSKRSRSRTFRSPRPRFPMPPRLPSARQGRGPEPAQPVDHRPGLRRRPRLPGGPVERGVLLAVDRDSVPVQQRGHRRGRRSRSTTGARPVRDQVADPHVCDLPHRQRAVHAGGLSPARRWSRSLSPTSRPAPTSRERPSPSWAIATARST